MYRQLNFTIPGSNLYVYINRAHVRPCDLFNPPVFDANALAFVVVVVVVALLCDARLFVVRHFSARQLGGRFIGAHGHRGDASRSLHLVYMK